MRSSWWLGSRFCACPDDGRMWEFLMMLLFSSSFVSVNPKPESSSSRIRSRVGPVIWPLGIASHGSSSLILCNSNPDPRRYLKTRPPKIIRVIYIYIYRDNTRGYLWVYIGGSTNLDIPRNQGSPYCTNSSVSHQATHGLMKSPLKTG